MLMENGKPVSERSDVNAGAANIFLNAKQVAADGLRWMHSDHLGTWDQQYPQTFNLYSYTGNNPINRIDPTGRFYCNITTDKNGPRIGNCVSDDEYAKYPEKYKDYQWYQRVKTYAFDEKGIVHTSWDLISFWKGTRADLSSVVSLGRTGARGAARLWTSTSKLSGVRNAFVHWMKHRKDFPHLQNAKQYVEAAHDFVTNPPAGTLTKIRNGDVILYHPGTNTFAIKAADGTPRTMFKPTLGSAYFHAQ